MARSRRPLDIYALVRRSEDHSLYEHHRDRVVVHHQPGDLPPWTARAIEWSLEPRLGRRWLTAPSRASATQGWLDHGTWPTLSPTRVAEARRQLDRLGLAADDIAELLGRPAVDRER